MTLTSRIPRARDSFATIVTKTISEKVAISTGEITLDILTSGLIATSDIETDLLFSVKRAAFELAQRGIKLNGRILIDGLHDASRIVTEAISQIDESRDGTDEHSLVRAIQRVASQKHATIAAIKKHIMEPINDKLIPGSFECRSIDMIGMAYEALIISEEIPEIREIKTIAIVAPHQIAIEPIFCAAQVVEQGIATQTMASFDALWWKSDIVDVSIVPSAKSLAESAISFIGYSR